VKARDNMGMGIGNWRTAERRKHLVAVFDHILAGDAPAHSVSTAYLGRAWGTRRPERTVVRCLRRGSGGRWDLSIAPRRDSYRLLAWRHTDEPTRAPGQRAELNRGRKNKHCARKTNGPRSAAASSHPHPRRSGFGESILAALP
jgi:hypothetical protein